MGRKCSVTGCASNYDSTVEATGHFHTFGFPSDATLSKLWLDKIPRADLQDENITENTCVCQLHFADRFIVKEDVFTDSTGKRCDVQL